MFCCWRWTRFMQLCLLGFFCCVERGGDGREEVCWSEPQFVLHYFFFSAGVIWVQFILVAQNVTCNYARVWGVRERVTGDRQSGCFRFWFLFLHPSSSLLTPHSLFFSIIQSLQLVHSPPPQHSSDTPTHTSKLTYQLQDIHSIHPFVSRPHS